VRWVVGVATLGGVLLLGLAVAAPHLAEGSPLLVVSTLAACVAVAALAAQPWLTRRKVPAHVRVGGVIGVLVAVHVLALVLESPDDALFAMSPDGPTRSRMALFATILLVAVTLLGLLRRRLRWSAPTWRFVHGSLAGLVVVLGVGHAVLIQGALDGWGTPVLLGLGGLGLVGVVVRLVAVHRAGGATPHDRGRVPAADDARP
jgi:predicted ferric reductase